MARDGSTVKRFIFLLILLAALIPTPGHTGLAFQIALVHPPQVLWEKSITTSNLFSLVHRNSIYDVLVWEAFRIDPEGLLWLSEIKTDSPSVLEYYGLEESQKDWIKQVRKIDSLRIRVTVSGEFWLEFNQEKINLSQWVPDGTLMEIRTRKIPDG
jgi:hypothetical protein